MWILAIILVVILVIVIISLVADDNFNFFDWW